MTFVYAIVLMLATLSLSSAQNTCASWTSVQDTNSVSFQAQPSATTLAACQTACLSHPTQCAYGFDWIYVTGATSNLCFVSLSSTTQSASGYRHYTCASLAGVVTTASTQASQVITTQASTPGGPTFVWTMTADTNSPGGVLKTNFGTLLQCQTGCIAAQATECQFGIDFNPTLPSGSGCYFATSATVNVGGYPGVNHYTYALQQAAPTCTNVETPNTNSPGGNLVTSATSLQMCQTACLAANNCSFGFDFNPSVPVGSQCYIATSTQLSSYPGVSHYVVSCTKPCTWTMTANQNSPGGKVMGSYSTLSTCQQACLTAPDTNSCQYGVDFQPTSPPGFQCWFSVSSTLTSFAGVNHYVPSCGYCAFTMLANQNSPGGLAQSSSNTLTECQNSCRMMESTTCKYGFDFAPTAPTGLKCWFSTTTTLNTAPGINHYNYQCNSTGGATAAPSGCTWDQVMGQNSPGGVAQGAVTSLATCQANCLAQKSTTCQYGFDWNAAATVGYQCWFATSTSLSSFPGVNHYNLNCGGYGGGGTNTCTWISVENMNTRNGVSQSFNTLDSCTAACLAAKNTTCQYGFDWQQNGQPNFMCWFSTTSTLSSFNGVVHYSLSCGGPTTVSNFGTTLLPVTDLIGYSFTASANSYTPGGVVKADANTLDQCKRACILEIDTGCKYGFDFNDVAPNNLRCWLSTISKTYPGTNITHYVAVKLPSCIWSKQESSNTPGGVLQTEVTSLEGCQAKCLQLLSTTCTKGFDYNTAGNQCYFSTSSTINSGTAGVDHYTCGTAPGASTINQQTTTFPVQISTTLPADLTCNWQLTANTNSPGGTPKAFDTLPTCQAGCILAFPAGTLKACPNGIDWVPGNPAGSKCFFATSTGTTTATGVSHYTCP